MSKLLTRERLVEALERLGTDLSARAIFVEIAIYGGSALMLQFEWRQSTDDVDALVRDGSDERALAPSVAEVARAMELEADWLNNAVGMFTPLEERDEWFEAGRHLSGRVRRTGSACPRGIAALLPRHEAEMSRQSRSRRARFRRCAAAGERNRNGRFRAAFRPLRLDPRRGPERRRNRSAQRGRAVRPRSLAEVAARTRNEADFDRHLRAFLDTFYGADGDAGRQASMLNAEPLPCTDRVADAFLGGVGEHLARRWHLPIPRWVRQPFRTLDAAIFYPDTKALRGYLLCVSPVAFRSRLIFTGPDPLQRARFPYVRGVFSLPTSFPAVAGPAASASTRESPPGD